MNIHEIKQYSRDELAIPVHVRADITAKWDGKQYDLREGVIVKYGTVVSWQHAYPKVQFEVSDVTAEQKAAKEIVNPLESNDRGTAFEGLGRRKRQG